MKHARWVASFGVAIGVTGIMLLATRGLRRDGFGAFVDDIPVDPPPTVKPSPTPSPSPSLSPAPTPEPTPSALPAPYYGNALIVTSFQASRRVMSPKGVGPTWRPIPGPESCKSEYCHSTAYEGQWPLQNDGSGWKADPDAVRILSPESIRLCRARADQLVTSAPGDLGYFKGVNAYTNLKYSNEWTNFTRVVQLFDFFKNIAPSFGVTLPPAALNAAGVKALIKHVREKRGIVLDIVYRMSKVLSDGGPVQGTELLRGAFAIRVDERWVDSPRESIKFSADPATTPPRA